ncbi:hypothetical protein Q3W71_08640 [Micromonospora sp. C28SCA-DRY-2]|uniref:hypothetical protein n=1 Tax=Micromonospora sp. C28SCA-DRY-2 TaxID=3059522 RepID=UPI002676EC05|nr:hypothetical protein [Micromonospora sp. C28SCA-DRY-2]MDO3701746.1 hypothetical protein [Micromonospora sp. C28SCA-DRY-2]
MQIRIEAQSRRGLRIIDEIPDIPLCKIEGYNGIGKTAAIKLLRLCAGDQPFAENDQDWRSFREQLVKARVTVTGLQHARTIEWRLDPSDWPLDPRPLEDRLGRIEVDGKTVNYIAIRSLFSVHHIIAAETPLKVLANRVEASRRHIFDWLEGSGERRQSDIDFAIDEVQKLVLQSLPSQLPTEMKAAEDFAKVSKLLTDELSDRRQRMEVLDRATSVLDRLDQVRGQGPEMQEKLDRLKEELDDLEAKTERLDDQITRASSRQHLNEQAEREFENARKFLVRTDKALRQATNELERLTTAAEVEPNSEQIVATQSELSRRLKELLERRPQVHAAPMLVSVLEDLAERLSDAERHELGQTTLLEGEEGAPSWSVSALRDACLRQAAKLRDRTPSGDAQQLEADIDLLRSRIAAVVQASAKLAEVEQAQANFSRAEKRLKDASESLPAQTAKTIDELIKARNELDQRSRSVQAAHARLEHAREVLGGGMTEDALAAELLRLCRQAEVEVARVRGRREQARAELDQLTRQQVQAVQAAERADRVLQDRKSRIAQVVELLTQDDAHAWLRAALPEVSALQRATVFQQAIQLDALSGRLEQARDKLQQQYAAIQGIGAALGRLYGEIGRSSSMSAAPTPWDRAARVWLASEVRDWFNDPLLRQSLFENADDLWLDWRDMRVHWTAEGEEMSRPLSGFSSGQQAFAYTHAQLAQLERDELGAANRLIALDEFNAFLDAERMRDLAVYLDERRLRQPHDQIVVILPLERIPPTEGGDDKQRSRIRDLRQRGYLTEAFSL